MFTDACPQESINVFGSKTWHTMAGVGLLLPTTPVPSGLIVPGFPEPRQVIAIPDPRKLAAELQPNARSVFREWKRIRRKRKPTAMAQIFNACQSGKCLFLSHSTLSHFAGDIADSYITRFCTGFVQKSLLIGHPEYLLTIGGSGKQLLVDRPRLISLTWIVHCLSIFLHKARESFGNIDGLFVHDNLPFNRDEDVEIINALLHGQDPGRIHFLTERRLFPFAPSDNFAAVINETLRSGNQTILLWGINDNRPKNFYMTVDDGNGGFTRYV